MRTEARPGGDELGENGLERRSDDLQDGQRFPAGFREQLIADCPPATATEIVGPKQVYRLVRTDPPTAVDFDSFRALHRERSPSQGLEECRFRGLSVHLTRASALRYLRKPNMAAVFQFICLVRLERGAGYIWRDGPTKHCTWWPLADFEVLPRCEMVGTDD